MITELDLENYLHRIHLELVKEYEKRGYPLRYIPTIDWYPHTPNYYRIIIETPLEDIIHSFICKMSGEIFKPSVDNRILYRISRGCILDDNAPLLFTDFKQRRMLTTIRR